MDVFEVEVVITPKLVHASRLTDENSELNARDQGAAEQLSEAVPGS